jgi:hypothetical protein
MVPNKRFIELLADIEPSATTKSCASAAHTGIREHLRCQANFRDKYVRSFLSGSYCRDTSIRPRTVAGGQERADVDIIVVTNFTRNDDPEDVLKQVCRALEDGGEGYEVERINKRSVRVETGKADMDIVPVIESGDGFLIADRDSGEWQYTNPPVHTQWSSDRNAEFDGRFKKLVKLLKWWRRENPSGRRPKGFILEVLTGLHGPKNETHLGEAFAQLLENICAAYSSLAKIGYKPTISDPAVPANDILGKVTLAQWKDFLEKVRVYADYARRAQDEDDMEEATRLWQKVFGCRFPKTASVAKASVLGGLASAPAVGEGYTFPGVAAAPKNPRGFA